jgi:hypothetical protein
MDIAKFAAASALALACAGAAHANVISLNFVGLQNLEPIDNYYNGGTGGFGSGPGPNYGITFGSSSLAIISVDNGGTGNFNGAPSDTVAFFLSGPGDVMDVAGGFTTGFSFYYSAVVYPGSVSVFSGLDGTGTELATINLAVTPSGGGICNTSYCPWFPTGVTFAGTAESVVFGGSANFIGFDAITLGSSTPGVPEPSTWAMMLLGVAGLGATLRSTRRKPALETA